MTAGRYDIQLDQGETYTNVLTWRDASGTLVNLTGYTVAMKVRDPSVWSSVILDVGGLAGGLTLGGAAGTITITIPPANTAALPYTGPLQYDLRVTSGSGVVTYLIQGQITARRQVTY
jgi:hypothetical protein